MLTTVEIRVSPELLHQTAEHRRMIAAKLDVSPSEITSFVLERRSIDARRGAPSYLLRFRVGRGEAVAARQLDLPVFKNVSAAEPAIVIGFGPAGMFAALKLIELGIKPVIFERGKTVRERRHDIAAITKRGEVNPDSNYCFGEGGAGTFSDGKLYTRSTKRGSTQRVLSLLVSHGANEDILIDAHPHIGTNKLPAVVQSIRQTILAHGGEVHFDSRVTHIGRSPKGGIEVRVGSDDLLHVRGVILATGHSARDVFSFLPQSGVRIERKPFSLGVRVEHPQALIDEIQYKGVTRTENLPAAAYSLVAQCDGRGVFSFCMCPGGIICPAATSGDEVVVNGWSPSKRNSKFANSGIVVEVHDSDYDGPDPLAGVRLQRELEHRAYSLGGGRQVAPAQRLTDFLSGRMSATLPNCSYLPGLRSVNLKELFPSELWNRLTAGFTEFGRKSRGYLTDEAVVVAVESRTSSPVRVPRDASSLMHPELLGLYPAGEGAGYAGGIMSAAMDGERCASALGQYYAR